MPDEKDGPENLNDPPSFFPRELSGDGDRSDKELVAVRLEGVYVAEAEGQTTRFLVLTDGMRRLPILIGPFEATAISLPLDGRQPDRPMTHDLIKIMIERLGSTVDRIVIDDLWSGTFYAKVFLEQGEDEIAIDSRPSDAIALAVRFEAPIYVSEDILEASLEG